MKKNLQPTRPLDGGHVHNLWSRKLIFAAFSILVIMNVALPKAGITVGGTPITFGYMLMILIPPLALLGLVRRPRISPAAGFHFLAFFLPLGLLALYKLMGADSSVLSLAICGMLFLVIPFVVLVLFSSYLEQLTERQIGRVLKWCISFVIVWGIFNFLLYAVSKQFLEIPYLTVNAGDVGEIYGKNNRRGELMKLVSTYSNGNVLGTCLVMLLPLYLYFTKSRLWV